ncbi:hypothetical protein A2Y99_01770 [Candidatus Gottesmanbacteria bacterium RBG_13_37_7]|uniref:Uncharacterized protein n=1 Tax=Candidatus Gottesmanbacteria bacterium RBG_13_37_7 TaxID=1798369 RepID=A0A1F5YHV5_9BACT|nr:MAG: hypothetical protein A2Y99_01770 [Candidatus Gottesmanbacteria bacterium RBG_13_37_7]
MCGYPERVTIKLGVEGFSMMQKQSIIGSNIGNIVGAKLNSLSPLVKKDLEAFIINTVKVKMIKKMDNLLEKEGCLNARKLFLIPVFTIEEIIKRVDTTAPEMRTLFYRELIEIVEDVERKI